MATTHPLSGQMAPEKLVELLSPQLERTPTDPRPVAIMMCGMSGSGKSTTSKTICQLRPDITRISIDGLLAARHGIFGRDYDAAQYDALSEQASDEFEVVARKLLSEGKDVVLDRAFYDKDDRDQYRQLVHESGGRVVLVYFDVPLEILLSRIKERRSNGITADCARELDEEMLKGWMEGFDVPRGEGEVVVRYER